MDCEKCEDLLLDELYGELDDVTSALVRRHVAGCSRCNATLSDMKGTRELVSSFPVVPAPSSLEDRIFAAEKEASKVHSDSEPRGGSCARRRVRRGTLGDEAANSDGGALLLMIGSTTFLLKGRSTTHSSAITVAQEGAPMASAYERKRSARAQRRARRARSARAATSRRNTAARRERGRRHGDARWSLPTTGQRRRREGCF